MTAKQPFYPHFSTNQVVTPAAGAATININENDEQVRLVNTGAAICYVKTYSSLSGALSATTADFPIAAGMASTITKGADHDRLSHISATGTTLQVMTGEGF